jgi:hypothetical protein
MSSCNERECKRWQEKMQDRNAQSMPRPLPVNASGVEKPPDISRNYDQAE